MCIKHTGLALHGLKKTYYNGTTYYYKKHNITKTYYNLQHHHFFNHTARLKKTYPRIVWRPHSAGFLGEGRVGCRFEVHSIFLIYVIIQLFNAFLNTLGSLVRQKVVVYTTVNDNLSVQSDCNQIYTLHSKCILLINFEKTFYCAVPLYTRKVCPRITVAVSMWPVPSGHNLG